MLNYLKNIVDCLIWISSRISLTFLFLMIVLGAQKKFYTDTCISFGNQWRSDKENNPPTHTHIHTGAVCEAQYCSCSSLWIRGQRLQVSGRKKHLITSRNKYKNCRKYILPQLSQKTAPLKEYTSKKLF